MKLIYALLGALIASPAYGWGYYDIDSNSNYNRNSNKAAASAGAAAGAYSGSSSGASVGVGVNNSVKNKVRNDNWNWNDLQNKQRQQMGQGQMQGNVGVGSGNDTTVNYEGDTVTYEAPKKADVPAYSPDAVAPPATATCWVGVAGSGGAAGVFSVGLSGYVKDHGCAFLEIARRAHAQGDYAVAKEALDFAFIIAKKEAGLKVESKAVTTKVVPVERTSGYTEDPFWFNQ